MRYNSQWGKQKKMMRNYGYTSPPSVRPAHLLTQMKHDRVVDTSFIYEGSDQEHSTPSLRDVVKVILGLDFQGGAHDSVTDAQVSVVFMR